MFRHFLGLLTGRSEKRVRDAHKSHFTRDECEEMSYEDVLGFLDGEIAEIDKEIVKGRRRRKRRRKVD